VRRRKTPLNLWLLTYHPITLIHVEKGEAKSASLCNRLISSIDAVRLECGHADTGILA
jgi:hypothetical protein